jgi:putative DNA primase/helicase
MKDLRNSITQPRLDEREQRAKARYLFRSSIAAAGTPVESYLRRRGIAVLSPSIRFLPPRKSVHHPAMLVPYGLPDEPEPSVIDIAEVAITAVQLTLLNPDGTGKADVKPNKISIASPAGKPMVIAPINDLLGLAICEGVEDALSTHEATGLGAWASGGASFMPKLAAAVPDYVEAVTICAHEDETGQRGAVALANALNARGVEVFIEGIKL